MSLTNEQKKLRLEGIGGSEIAAVAGINPWATPLDVWRAKCDPAYVVEETPAMRRGTFLEAGLVNWYAHETSSTVRRVGTIRHPSIARVLSTPDALVTPAGGSELDLSIKSPGRFLAKEWGEPWTDEAPAWAVVQVQWELLPLGALHGIQQAHIAALIDGELRVFVIQADPEIQGQLVDKAHRFWRDFIETKTPPPVDGSESSSRWLEDMFPQHDGPLLPPTPEADVLMRRIFELRTEAKRLELEEDAAKNRLKQILGNAQGMCADAWKFTWKLAKGRASTDWKAIAKEIGIPDSLIQKHTKVSPDSPRFTPTWKEK